LPQPNANDYAAGKSDAYTHSYGHGDNYAGKSDADCYGYDYTTAVSYAHSDRDGDNHAETYADAKATAYAISSSDAVSEWVKKLKELQSNRELARQLASSLLCGAVAGIGDPGIWCRRIRYRHHRCRLPPP
jgi:hypothetical protein